MLHEEAVFRRVRKVVAVVLQRSYDEVHPENDLSDHLGFDRIRKQVLAPKLNTEFTKEGLALSPGDTEKATTVGSLCAIVWERLQK